MPSRTITLAVLALLLLVSGGQAILLWRGWDTGGSTIAAPDTSHDNGQLPAGQNSASSPKGTLFINEFMAENDTTLVDPQGTGFPDWLELYNAGTESINLQGLYMTDDLSKPTQFQITQTLIISPQNYLIIFADNDSNQGPNHINLKLSAAGEALAIFDVDGRSLIDGYTFGAQAADVSEGRCPDGTSKWIFFPQAATPGAANGPCTPRMPPIISRTSYTPAVPAITDAVAISAVVIDDGTVNAVHLAYRVDGGAFMTATMNLAETDLYIGQIPPQTDDSLVEYYVTATDDLGLTTTAPSTAPTITFKYISGFDVPPIVINEIMADNQTTLEDPNEADEFPDWIELYNTGDAGVDLGGLYLSDDPANLTQFRIPNGTVIPAQGHLIFYADNDPQQGVRHLPFKLAAEGETLSLWSIGITQVQVDKYAYDAQNADMSVGRAVDGGEAWQVFSCATPEEANAGQADCGAAILLPLVSRSQ